MMMLVVVAIAVAFAVVVVVAVVMRCVHDAATINYLICRLERSYPVGCYL